jgi:hypothetical protein
MLKVPACTSAGETSTTAAGRAGVAELLGPLPDDAGAGAGLATALTVAAGAEEGSAAPGAETHALAASSTVEKSDKTENFHMRITYGAQTGHGFHCAGESLNTNRSDAGESLHGFRPFC